MSFGHRAEFTEIQHAPAGARRVRSLPGGFSRWRRHIATTAVVLGACLGIIVAAGTSAGAATPSPARSPGTSAAAVKTPLLVRPTVCAFQTYNGHYLTAVGGGGRITDVLHTDATRVGSWEKFTLIDSGDANPYIRYGFVTYNGHYLTAVGGGGRITDVMHSDATILRNWEKLELVPVGGGYHSIQTVDGHYLTAVGGGGRITDTIHSDATRVGTWEKFRVTCGL